MRRCIYKALEIGLLPTRGVRSARNPPSLSTVCVHGCFSREKFPWLPQEPQRGSVVHQRLRTSDLEGSPSSGKCMEPS